MLEFALLSASVTACFGYEMKNKGLDVSKMAAIREQGEAYLVTGIENQEHRTFKYVRLANAQRKMQIAGYLRMKPKQEAKWAKLINDLHGDPKVIFVYYKEGARNCEDATMPNVVENQKKEDSGPKKNVMWRLKQSKAMEWRRIDKPQGRASRELTLAQTVSI